nr:myosin light chain kinase, smooth muscle isoform X2 [Nothobranchius furzeri]
MNANESKQRFVSTLKLNIKPPRASCAERSGSRTTDSRIAERSPSADSKDLDTPVFTSPQKICCVGEERDFVLGGGPIKVTLRQNGEGEHFENPLNRMEVRFVVKERSPEDAGSYTCVSESCSVKTPVSVREFKSECRVMPTSGSENTVENGQPPPASKHPEQNCEESFCFSPMSPMQSPLSSPREVLPKKRNNSEKVPKLSFQNPPEHLEVKVGQTAKLTCSFLGSPPVVSCWIRNKEQIVDDAEVWTENTNQSSTLVIAEASPQHTGHYTIVVKDRKSSAQHTLILSVIDKPEPPASCPLISRESASSLVLSWSGPCYDGGSAVLGYVVEVKNLGPAEPAEWRELTALCKSTSYKVSSGLRPQQEYRFRVRAYNAVGASEPGPASAGFRMEHRDLNNTQDASQPYTCVTIDSSHKVTDHYNQHEKLGTGKFGLVFKLTHKETGHVCAGKYYKGRRAKEREAARQEIEMMNDLHHPKLVQCLAAYDHKPEMVMVMEYIAGGELFERIVDDNFEHTEPASERYMKQILEGIAYMHEKNIVHLDLKPENIVCVDPNGTSIKIIDFGLARKLDDLTPLRVMHGTPEFVAPEVINYEPVCLATDMWSIGVICYILLSGESPFQGNSDTETLALVTAAQWEFDEESFEDITEEAKDFISCLLNKDPRRRKSCEEALAHSWVVKFDSGDVTSTKTLSKEKMKKFLARQKWKKAGKALQALKRMALLSKSDSAASPTSPMQDLPLSPEAEDALQSLDQKMQGPPQFTQSLEDQTVDQGSCAHLTCHIIGYPDPEVLWLCGDEPLEESPSLQIEYEDDGRCTLILPKVSPKDSNVYTCRATNEHGETVSSAKLTVL